MKTISIYTDGSHLDKLNNGRLGCGGVMIDSSAAGYGKKLGEFSEELRPAYLQAKFGSSNVSNPTAEMIGALMALQKFDIPEDADEIIIYADFIGIREWMTGNWKIKEPYIKKVKETIDKVIAEKGFTGKIKFEWVKGHQSKSVMTPGAYWNSYVDILAKGKKP